MSSTNLSAGTSRVSRVALAGFAGASALYLGALIWAMVQLPERVAMHFGTGGVNRWGTQTEHLILSLVVYLAVGVLPVALSRWANPAIINVPHKAYWTSTPELVAELRRRLAADLLGLSAALLVAMALVVQVGVVQATRHPDGDFAGWTAGALAALAIGLVAWLIWMVGWRYRPPRDVTSRTSARR